MKTLEAVAENLDVKTSITARSSLAVRRDARMNVKVKEDVYVAVKGGIVFAVLNAANKTHSGDTSKNPRPEN